MAAERLSKDTWIAAGFETLADSGPASLQINVLAAKLKATKGSFYWHFTDFAAYKAALLLTWKQKAVEEIVIEVNAETTPRTRLEILVNKAAEPAPTQYGGPKIETAMRAWALSDSEVAKALEELDVMRLRFVKELFGDLGIENAPNYAELFYGAYIGLDDLQSKGRADMRSGLEILLRLLA